MLRDGRDGALAAVGLGDHLDQRVLAEEAEQLAPGRSLIVDDENPQRRLRAHGSDRYGSDSVTSAPPPSRLAIASRCSSP